APERGDRRDAGGDRLGAAGDRGARAGGLERRRPASPASAAGVSEAAGGQGPVSPSIDRVAASARAGRDHSLRGPPLANAFGGSAVGRLELGPVALRHRLAPIAEPAARRTPPPRRPRG